MKVRTICLSASLLLLASPSVLPARDQGTPEKIELHGFGSWWYGNTSANEYLGGLPDGSYESAEFSLNVAAQVSDRLRLAAQVDFHEDEREKEVHMDYAFAEWKFSDALRLRAGKVKLPFGISTEVSHVGTLHPFIALPQAVYGPAGLAGQSYKGAGVTGGHALGRGWDSHYDAYAGGMDVEEFKVPQKFLFGEPIDEEELTESEATRNMAGGRLVFETPVDGLSFGASAFTGREVHSDEGTVRGRRVRSGQVEYLNDHWSVRAEAAYERVLNDKKVNARYLEAAYRFGAHWQGAVQLDYLTADLWGMSHPQAPSMLYHKEGALGVNYWFSPALVLKLSFHRVSGNWYALPDPGDLETVVASGDLKTRTSLVMFGAQFSF